MVLFYWNFHFIFKNFQKFASSILKILCIRGGLSAGPADLRSSCNALLKLISHHFIRFTTTRSLHCYPVCLCCSDNFLSPLSQTIFWLEICFESGKWYSNLSKMFFFFILIFLYIVSTVTGLGCLSWDFLLSV